MKKFEEYLEEGVANKQITVSLDTGKRELTFALSGLFPPALISAMGKALKGGKFSLQGDQLTVYI